VSETTTLRQRVGGWLREVIAPAAWAYTVVKLAVFDLDRTMLMAVAPTQVWLLDYRFFILLAAVVALLLVLGPAEFLWLCLFVVTYPFIVLFWRVPKRIWRQWPLILIFLPALGAAVTRLWATFLVYAVAAFGALFVLVASRQWLVAAGVACLIPLLVVHLARSLRKAYAASLLTQLVGLIEELRVAVENGQLIPWNEQSTPVPSPAASTLNPRQIAYSWHWFAILGADRIRTVARRRYYDIYLLASWFYTVLLTAGLFALVHLGLNKAMPHSYADADGASFWSFVGFSLGVLTTSNVSKISPVAVAANIATYAEVLCSVVILVILVFSILTAAREAFRENLDELVSTINRLGTALETSITTHFRLTVVELEAALMTEMPAYVNQLRRVRGLPELVAPPSTPSGGEPPS
jgi:hypothetical protein